MRKWIGMFIVVNGSLWAQSESASLGGTVADAGGSLIPQVVISVRNEGTGVAVRTVTDESGRYFLPGLRPAMYTVTAEHTGFKKFVNAGLTLQVNQAARLDHCARDWRCHGTNHSLCGKHPSWRLRRQAAAPSSMNAKSLNCPLTDATTICWRSCRPAFCPPRQGCNRSVSRALSM